MKNTTRYTELTRIAVFILAAGVALSSGAVHPGESATSPTVVSGAGARWGAAPPSLPPGAQAWVLHGSPAKEGPFVIRLRFPAGFVVPPHQHSKDELVTVISGNFSITPGDKVDRSASRAMPPASFFHLPAGMTHYAVAETETVVQINGVGPFDVVYVNPRDDPRSQ